MVPKNKHQETIQTQEQQRHNEISVQAAKCMAKETQREHVLGRTLMKDSTTEDWKVDGYLAKSKKRAVALLMTAANPRRSNEVKQSKKKGTKKGTLRTQTKVGMTSRKKVPPKPPRTVQEGNTKEKNQRTVTLIHMCGCRHGDLRALKSFNKANATYYSRPNRFLENQSCLDCKLVVGEMIQVNPRQGGVVFYCDEGIKGFSAPDDDPMKEELTCDLILCPQCEAKRQVTFEKADKSGREGGGRKRKRHQKEN